VPPVPPDTDLDDDSIEADWKAVRPAAFSGGHHEPEAEALPDLEEPVLQEGLDNPWLFAERLRTTAWSLDQPRTKFIDVRSDLLFRAAEAGLNPRDVPPEAWVGTAAEYREYGGMIGLVAPATQSTSLGLRLLGISTLLMQRRSRSVVALQIRNIAEEVSPATPSADDDDR
jgi:hypothetical protein